MYWGVLLKLPTTDPPTTYHLPANPTTIYPPTHRLPILTYAKTEDQILYKFCIL